MQPFRGGYIRRDGYKHNEEVTFGCRDPLVIDGQVTLRCNDGTWNNRLPTCGGLCIFLKGRVLIVQNNVITRNTIFVLSLLFNPEDAVDNLISNILHLLDVVEQNIVTCQWRAHQ